MSFEAMAWATRQNPHNTTAKLCLLIMSSMANQDGECWPSHQYLADQCLCSRRNIINVIKRLESDGYIVTQARNRGKERTSNLYTMRLNRTSMGKGGSEYSSLPSEYGSPGGSEQAAQETITISKLSGKHIARTEFERWWKHYPRKVGKKNAWAVWQKTKPDADKLIADTEERKTKCGKWVDGFIKDPERYLKREQWNDEFVPIRKVKQKVVTTPADRNYEAQRLWEEKQVREREVFEHDEIS